MSVLRELTRRWRSFWVTMRGDDLDKWLLEIGWHDLPSEVRENPELGTEFLSQRGVPPEVMDVVFPGIGAMVMLMQELGLDKESTDG